MIDWNEAFEEMMEHDEDPNSHRELDPWVFHPSQVGQCKRQCYLSKLGLEKHDPPQMGAFKTGTIIHEWIEETLPEIREDTVQEAPIEHEVDNVTFVGHADCVQFLDDLTAVYDYKTKGSFYYYDPPCDRHIDQLTIYMDAIGAEVGQIVYLGKKKLFREGEDKENWWIETYPEAGLLHMDKERLRGLVDKASEIAQTIERRGLPANPAQIPYDKCGCWICGIEQLDEDAFF